MPVYFFKEIYVFSTQIIRLHSKRDTDLVVQLFLNDILPLTIFRKNLIIKLPYISLTKYFVLTQKPAF